MPQFRVLILGYVWPEPNSSAAGLRDWNLIDTFLSAGWSVTFASSSPENEYSLAIRNRGIPTFTVQANDSSFDSFVKKLNPDFVIFDRFLMEEQFGWRVEENCPNAIRVLDSQDMHFLRRGREEALKSGRSLEEIQNCQFDLVTETALRELASVLRCDSTLIISGFEMELLTQRFQISPDLLFLSRLQYDPPLPAPEFSERSGFMMIGNFRHPPNTDAVHWLRNEIWPLIRKKLPNAQVHIYGSYPPKSMMQLSNKNSGFHVLGTASDQFEVLRKHRVNLAPLRFGAGIKGKISDGWWAGAPNVTTSIGAEGMGEALSEALISAADTPWGGEIADTPEDFAEKAASLYTQESLWKARQLCGYETLSQLYSREKNSAALIEHFRQLHQTFHEKRRSNIYGAILRHHLHRSTKYFSKWIEEKNMPKKPEKTSSQEVADNSNSTKS